MESLKERKVAGKGGRFGDVPILMNRDRFMLGQLFSAE